MLCAGFVVSNMCKYNFFLLDPLPNSSRLRELVNLVDNILVSIACILI